jgi:hypothetical protein
MVLTDEPVNRPGTGQNVGHFDRQRITGLFLIEPNVGIHTELESNLKKAGLHDMSTIIRLYRCVNLINF